jgi:hypothetical protein
VEPLAGAVLDHVLVQVVEERGPVAADTALPPRPRRLGRQTTRVRQQLRDRQVPEGRPRHVLVERVVQVQPALVAQPHHQHRDERLGDRPDAVLRVGRRCGAADVAPAAGPQHVAAAHDGGDQRRRAVLRLFGGETAEQGELGGLEHGPILTENHS